MSPEKKKPVEKIDIQKRGVGHFPTPLFSVRVSYREKEQLGKKTPPFLFIVSKKVAKTAVARNKIKRRCRHIVRAANKTTSKGKTTIFYLREAARSATYEELKKQILKAIL